MCGGYLTNGRNDLLWHCGHQLAREAWCKNPYSKSYPPKLVDFFQTRRDKEALGPGSAHYCKNRVENKYPANHSCKDAERQWTQEKEGRTWKETVKNTVKIIHADLQHWGKECLVVGDRVGCDFFFFRTVEI